MGKKLTLRRVGSQPRGADDVVGGVGSVHLAALQSPGKAGRRH